MGHKMLQYRGSLKSCNYQCSYCPFSKKKVSQMELDADWRALRRFRQGLQKKAFEYEAIQIIPYGEALIHSYYWEEMAYLSAFSYIKAVGVQTNLSFSVEHCLQQYESLGGRKEKLRLWCSFHPEMVSISDFVKQCSRLLDSQILFCIGAVGVPKNINLLEQLRRELPKEIYLWINPMDGLKRRYTKEEQAKMCLIDPWFERELLWKRADAGKCRERLFLEADGSEKLCVISQKMLGNWYLENNHRNQGEEWREGCKRTVCSCYLAYGGRKDLEERMAFGRFPLFRIPWKPKAFFLDLDGTLLLQGQDIIEENSQKFLEYWSKRCPLFLATSRDYKDVYPLCNKVLKYFSGGIFASGAHLILYGKEGRKERELYHPLSFCVDQICMDLKELGRIQLFHALIYKNKNKIYKITLRKPRNIAWSIEEAERIKTKIFIKESRWFVEENCLQIVSNLTDKGKGLLTICQWIGVQPEDTVSAGNAEEDIAMLRVSGYGIAMPNSPEAVILEADEKRWLYDRK